MKPDWIVEAEKFIGQKELTGRNDHPLLDKGWLSFGMRWLFGQPWCGLFVAHCLRESGQFVPKLFYRAKSFLNYGEKIDTPCYGCIVVFTRDGGGHVGFVVGKDTRGRLLVLGGNQGNKVSVAPFEMSRVDGYRIPFGYQPTVPLMTMTSYEPSSINEA